MTPYALRQAALDMNISYPSAVKMRARYLVSQMVQCEEWIDGDNVMPQVLTGECIDELSALVRSLQVVPNTNVTPEMIEQARGVDVRTLIEFKHGKATAWCHADKAPSLTYMSKTNQAWCAACDLWFDSIKIQRELTGVGFKDAVLALCK